MIHRQKESLTEHGQGLKSFVSTVMIALFFQFGTAVFLPSVPRAESQYVIPSSEIPVRRGQGTDYKIVALISDGTRVEVLERGEAYSLVRLDNEKQGWILTRFLSDQPPLTEAVAALTSENQALKLQQEQSESKLRIQEQQHTEKTEELSQSLTATEEKLRSAEAQNTTLAAAFEKLKKDTANVVEIKDQLANVTDENNSIKETLAVLTRENERLKSDERINWFLAGGGVLLLGIIIGKITSRSRKRKPSLL
jgi:SH3 domain protein